jgi:hypothetical protein
MFMQVPKERNAMLRSTELFFSRNSKNTTVPSGFLNQKGTNIELRKQFNMNQRENSERSETTLGLAHALRLHGDKKKVAEITRT